MSSIEKRERDGKVRWYARYRDPAGQQKTKTFDRKVDAEKFLTSVEHSKLSGSYIDPAAARLTVGDLTDQWLNGKVDLKPTTRALYESVVSTHIRPRWGTVPLAKVTHGDLQAWVAELVKSGLSGGHVRKVTGVLSGVLGLAVRDRRLVANPATGLSLPSVTERSRRYLTTDQVRTLAEAAGLDGQLVVLVLSFCGLRWGEMAALRVRSVDLLRRRLNVSESMTEVNGGVLVWGTPKSHESRSVPVPRFLVEALARHLEGRAANDLVFTTPTGAPLRNRNARRAWFDRAAEAAGVKGLTPHELRHYVDGHVMRPGVVDRLAAQGFAESLSA